LNQDSFLQAKYIWLYHDKLNGGNWVQSSERNSDIQNFSEREWQASMHDILMHAEHITGSDKWINPPSLFHLNNNKTSLMLQAKSMEIPILDFCITNVWKDSFTSPQVLKTIYPNRIINIKENLAFANMIAQPDELNQLSNIHQSTPFFIQQMAKKRVCEYRIYYLLGEIVVMKLTTQHSAISFGHYVST